MAQAPFIDRGWCLRRRVLPQHADHAGVMWHGAYLAWLEEARVEALGSAGLPYHRLANQGVELPIMSLRLEYRKPLLLGDSVEMRSRLLPRRGLRLRWLSQLLSPRGDLAAEAEVVLTAVIQGPEGPSVLRRLPPELVEALSILEAGPPL